MKKLKHSSSTSSSSGLSHYDQLHHKNPYFHKSPNLYQLAVQYPEIFGQYVTSLDHSHHKVKVDWKSPQLTKGLTQALLLQDFGLTINLPEEYLCPPLPNRLNYLCWIDDLLDSCKDIKCVAPPVIMDIGTGASLIYPLLGVKQFGWNFFGIDINEKALDIASSHLMTNLSVQRHIQLKVIQPSDTLQKLIRDHYLSAFLQSSAATSSSASSVDSLIPSLLQLVQTAISTSTADISVNESIQRFRGQIRHSLSKLEDVYLHRLMDCEHFTFHDQLSTHRHALSHDNLDLSNRHNKKVKRREEEMDEDSENEHDEEIGANRVGNHATTAESSRRTPILSVVMTNPPFYDLNEEVISCSSIFLSFVSFLCSVSLIFFHFFLFSLSLDHGK
jgi:hypothetical protein